MDAKLQQLRELSYLLPPRIESLIGGSVPLVTQSSEEKRSRAAAAATTIQAAKVRSRRLLGSFRSWTKAPSVSFDDRPRSGSRLWWSVEHHDGGARVLMRKYTTADEESEVWMIVSVEPARKFTSR